MLYHVQLWSYSFVEIKEIRPTTTTLLSTVSLSKLAHVVVLEALQAVLKRERERERGQLIQDRVIDVT